MFPLNEDFLTKEPAITPSKFAENFIYTLLEGEYAIRDLIKVNATVELWEVTETTNVKS